MRGVRGEGAVEEIRARVVDLRDHEVVYGGCVAGAWEWEDGVGGCVSFGVAR